MAKTTVAQLEAVITEQQAHIMQLAKCVAELTEGMALLNQRLDNAGTAFKTLRESVAASRPVTRVQPAARPNPWHTAVNQLRAERGLEPTAWVPREEILARMEANAGN